MRRNRSNNRQTRREQGRGIIEQQPDDSYSEQYRHSLLYPNCEEHASEAKKDFTVYCDHFKAYCPIRVFRPCLKRVSGKPHTVSIAGVDISTSEDPDKVPAPKQEARRRVVIQSKKTQRYKK